MAVSDKIFKHHQFVEDRGYNIGNLGIQGLMGIYSKSLAFLPSVKS